MVALSSLMVSGSEGKHSIDGGSQFYSENSDDSFGNLYPVSESSQEMDFVGDQRFGSDNTDGPVMMSNPMGAKRPETPSSVSRSNRGLPNSLPRGLPKPHR